MAIWRTTWLLCLTIPFLLGGCLWLLRSEGGGQTDFKPPRVVNGDDVALPDGYRIKPVATGLTYPTGVAFDAAGVVHVTEAGWSYGAGEPGVPRLLRIEPDGQIREIARGTNPPWNGIVFHPGSIAGPDGAFYVAGGHLEGGEVLRIGMDGRVTTVLTGLPSYGDHHTNGPVAGPDGSLYFGQGTATNSAVVGVDSYQFGWLKDHPNFHDVPCQDLTLTGVNYQTQNPLTSSENDRIMTGAYVPFGTPTEEGQVIPGETYCGGAVFRLSLTGEHNSTIELVAWGLRNPFGLAFDPEGRLYATDNGYDVRGSRPAWGTGDFLWHLDTKTSPPRWHGWPDFAGGVPLHAFEPPGKDAPELLLQEPPNEPPSPAALLGVHSSSNGLDFSRNNAFGYFGDAFIAQFGDMAPQVGKVIDPVGYRVVRVDVDEGIVSGFAENRQQRGPASLVGGGGLERPVAVRFSPDGTALYVVDFGVMTMGEQGPQPQPGTGVLWKITREMP